MARFRTSLGLLALVLGAAACQADKSPPTTSATGEIRGNIEWSMAERFGVDANGDGLPDIPNTLEYVLNLPTGACDEGCREPAAFDVTLDASGVELVSLQNPSAAIDSYLWQIVTDSGEAVFDARTDLPEVDARLAEGDYRVTLRILGEGVEATVGTRITVEDTLLVALGDSFGGGEGNPERPGDPATWADSGATDRTQQDVDHEQAHRSSLAAAAQAALELERRDPRSSVTFVFLAASGASIDAGLLGPPEDVAATDTSGFRGGLQPQLDEMEEILGCEEGSCLRSVDALTMSVGGNDIEFSFALGSLVALEPQLLLGAYDNLLDRLLGSVTDKLDALPESFAALAGRLDALGIEHVFLNGYPSGSHTEADGMLMRCEEAGGDLVPGLEVDSDELQVLDQEIIAPLNEVLRAAAATHDWTYVDGHLDLFRGHGYCGTDPYSGAGFRGNPFPAAVQRAASPGERWFRQAGESVEIQGGGGFFEPARLGTAGTFHPNEYGHLAYAQALLDAMEGA